jgi:hypothetical protein
LRQHFEQPKRKNDKRSKNLKSPESPIHGCAV